MQGNKPQKGAAVDYDHFKISTTAKSGKLFFDDIIFSQYQDDRHQYPDLLVPFIKKDQIEGKIIGCHWQAIMKEFEIWKKTPISTADKMDLQKFEKLMDDDLRIDKKYKVYINTLNDLFQKLDLKDNGKTVTGPPLTFKED